MKMKHLALLVSLVLCLAPIIPVAAQKKSAVPTSALCTRDNAVDTTKQQLLLTRTFDNLVQRITVLLRAADLLWPHEQDKAMAAFTEAFDLAVQNYKETGDQVRPVSQSQFAMRINVPDQRFRVLSALAKRDPATARKLSEQMLQSDAKEVADKPATDVQSKRKTAEKLLLVAYGLIETDIPTALNFARQSFRYPAVLQLPMFLYELGKTNKAAGDQFYV
jgi:hypothetical protein